MVLGTSGANSHEIWSNSKKWGIFPRWNHPNREPFLAKKYLPHKLCRFYCQLITNLRQDCFNMKYRFALPIIVFIAPLILSLQTKSPDLLGQWRASLSIPPDEIPFGMGIFQQSGKWHVEVYNGEEVLALDELVLSGDSVTISMGIFDAEIRAKIVEPGILEGVFVKNTIANYVVPFKARKGDLVRFPTEAHPTAEFSGKWKTVFKKAN